MKNAFFPGNAAWNEHSKWLQLFTSPIPVENNSQVFSNFGSKNETILNETDMNSMIDAISEKLAIDVFHAIRNDVNANSNRSAYTANVERNRCRPITGNQAIRIAKKSQHFVSKGRTIQIPNLKKVFAKSRLAGLS